MWNRVTPIALPTTRTLENYNLKAGNTKKKKKRKLCITCHRLKLMVLLFLLKNPQKNVSIRLLHGSKGGQTKLNFQPFR